MATQEKQNTKNLLTINVPKHERFNDVIRTATLTSTTLEEKIATLFRAVFDDFEGCKIVPTTLPQGGQKLSCKLYFKPCTNKNENGLYAVKSRGEGLNKLNPQKGSFFTMVDNINMMASSKLFELEDDAKELLSEFIIVPQNEAKFIDRYSSKLNKVIKVRLPKNWNKYTEEISDKIQGTMVMPYFVVNTDLTLIVSKLYGKKAAQSEATTSVPKDVYQYAVNIVKVLNAQAKSFVLEVRRINMNEFQTLCNAVGGVMPTGNIIMTRGK